MNRWNSKAETKSEAQDLLMHHMASAFYAIDDDDTLTKKQKQTLTEVTSKEMARLEKFFGYNPYSWGRG